MLAVDTNVIIRYLTRDDREQFAKADALIREEDVYVCTTVLLETEWVLRRAYGFSPTRIVAALRAFAGLPSVILEDAPRAARALEWMEGGMDFADALHLSTAGGCEAFVTFDRRFAAAARRMTGVEIRMP